jgi:hypothetical protein
VIYQKTVFICEKARVGFGAIPIDVETPMAVSNALHLKMSFHIKSV